jgi:hypothetical protein
MDRAVSDRISSFQGCLDSVSGAWSKWKCRLGNLRRGFGPHGRSASANAFLLSISAVVASSFLGAPAVAAQIQANRTALVIGNGAYEGNVLPNAGPDSAATALALDALGFDVVYVREADKGTLSAAVTQFAGKLKAGGVGLVYFAGHAVQLRGQNYLIPIGTSISDLADVPRLTVSLEAVFKALSAAPLATGIVFLDACRANPFPRVVMSGLSASQDWVPGLTIPANAPPGTIVAFSTSPGQTASDGSSLVHSPYTGALLKYIREPGLPLDEFFQRVRRDVVATNPSQTPWENTAQLSRFLFREPAYVEALITSGDDDVFLNVNGIDAASWSADGNRVKKILLKAGSNSFQVDVFNQHTNRGILGIPEGWKYALELAFGHDGKTSTLDKVFLDASEDVPEKDGPRHGKRFRVAVGEVFVDPVTSRVSITRLDTRIKPQ